MRPGTEKDQLIERLVHDNEVLMREVGHLNETAQQMTAERDEAVQQVEQLKREQQSLRQSSATFERMISSMEEQLKLARTEREVLQVQHAGDKEMLSNIFRELEASLTTARAEREETQSRAATEKRSMSKRVRELEESLHAEKVRGTWWVRRGWC